MKVPTIITTLIQKKKTPLQRLMGAITPNKKRLPVLKKNISKKWRKLALRKTLKAKGRKMLLSFKKGRHKKYIPTKLLQRMG